MPTPDTVIAFRTLTNLGMNQPGYSLFAAEMTSADERPDAINGAFGYLAPMTKLVPSKALDEFAAPVFKKNRQEGGHEFQGVLLRRAFL